MLAGWAATALTCYAAGALAWGPRRHGDFGSADIGPLDWVLLLPLVGALTFGLPVLATAGVASVALLLRLGLGGILPTVAMGGLAGLGVAAALPFLLDGGWPRYAGMTALESVPVQLRREAAVVAAHGRTGMLHAASFWGALRLLSPTAFAARPPSRRWRRIRAAPFTHS